ncbi:TonB family protein [Inhella proteolytica]|uniref:TonB family protein n=1 Tax=Inhella proteolytica TaxID=2795029 RepID=A0A931IYH8_9BURK|nr:TonB family protein [Inhella proteolytica]MBH9576111.1 TonB family protein [Inhella proteolytica]
MAWGGTKRGLCVMVAAALAGGAWAQSDGKISDTDRAKRDAEKVFSFIKFHTVKPAAAAAPAKPAPAAAKPAAAPAPRPSSGGSQVANATPASSASGASEPVVTRSLEPAAPPPHTSTQPVAAPVNTLPPAASVPPTATPEPEPEAEAEEVPLKLEQYVAPEMTRQVLEAIGGRDHVVPVRFTVEPNGVVSKAEAREGGNRRLGQAAARAVQQWRFGPLPERRVVDVELLFRANSE